MQVTSEHWLAIQERLRERVGDNAHESWLAPLSLGNSKTDNVVVNVPTRFMRDWVLRHYHKAITETITEVTGKDLSIAFEVGGLEKSPLTATRKAEDDKENAAKHAQNASAKQPKPAQGKIVEPDGNATMGNPLNQRYTFDSFVIGKSNEFAYTAAKSIAESEGILYNPFLLYGGVGLGKTHLMHAIAWHVREQYPHRRVMYISSEKFVFQFISSLKNKKNIDFKEAFRSVDLLMIDDIQFIAGKEASQEEFFHTLNALMDMHKQVILTADRSPHEMDNVDDRLRSRLSSGLVTEIHRPNLEMRVAILQHKAAERGIDLPKDVTMFLADRIASNVRELEGALNRLVAHTQFTRQEITLDNVQDLLKDIFQAHGRSVTVDDIQMKVAEHFGIKMQDMHSQRRTKNIARPRQVAMYLAKNLTTRSYPDIGKSFGGKDHTTVMHAVKTIEKRRADDASLDEDLRILEKILTRSQ